MLIVPRILVAEDDPFSASLLEQLLDDYEVRIVSDGRQAWEIAQAENFHLMLLDVMMPEMDGLELCRRLRQQERNATTPIILVTARTQTEDMVAGFEAGASDYVTKPIAAAALRARVATHLKMADLQRQRDELTTMVTHDLKTPLTLILGSVAHLRQRVLSDSCTQDNCLKFLVTIRNNVNRMTAMINNRLTLSRLESGRFPLHRAAFDPQRMADALFENAEELARPKSLDLAIECSELPDRIYADESTLSRALDNLIANAIKFSPEGGQVLLCLETQDDRIVFTVEDAGPGVPEALLPLIFNRYERQFDAEAEGVGLGLTIAKFVAQAHGGDVAVENLPEAGARFVLWIPIVEEDAE